MAFMRKRILCLGHVFIPRLIAFETTTPSPSYLSILFFSTLAEKHVTHLRSPFADFAATRFNLSSAEIARVLKNRPSLDNPKTLQNAERTVNVLTKYGCTEHQVAHIMRSYPSILTISAEKLVEPKLQLLKDLGIEEKDLPKLLLKAPGYLGINLQEGLLSKIAFLKSIFQSQKLLLKAVKTCPYILTYSLEKHLRPSLTCCEGFGLQREEFVRFLSSNPYLLLRASLTPPKVDLIRKIDICKESKTYKNVLRAVVQSKLETLESNMDTFRQWGLSAEEIWELFRTSPSAFTLSKDTLRQKMEFVVNTMELPPNYVVKHSAFLKCSLEKLLKARFVVFQRIKSLNGVEHLKSKQLYSLVALSEAKFVNKISKGHPELETLYALHKKAIPKVSSPLKGKFFK